MIEVSFDDNKQFLKEMNNLVAYAGGFLDGAKSGMPFFLASVGEKTKEILEQFIDANARSNPEALHHVYEWYQTGSPEGRLFDIDYQITNVGLSMSGTFTQSQTVKAGSKDPFYDKAKIMEEGIGVTIAPKRSTVLVFEDAGKTVFTSNSVRVDNPGGSATQGSFDRTFEMFFTSYFRQSFMEISGLKSQLGSLMAFTNNLQAGMRIGRGAGVSAGAQWIKNIGASI